MFRALLAHPQEEHLVYSVRIMSVGSGTVAVKLTLYTRNIPNAVCASPPEDEKVMFEILEAFDPQ
jgi:hypothetical protein